jgi:hypothetical protein
MKNKKITFDQLEKTLLRLGYTTKGQNGDRVVLSHPDSDLPVIMRRMKQHEILQPIDLLSVQNTLANGGIVPKAEFESLFLIKKGDVLVWTEPNTRGEVTVTAAADESDGTVIIKHKGTFSPCPVDQLRKLHIRGTVVLTHRAISKRDIKEFEEVMGDLGVKMHPIEERAHGQNAFTVTRWAISYNPDSDLMTREERQTFNQQDRWDKIKKEWQRVGFTEIA